MNPPPANVTGMTDEVPRPSPWTRFALSLAFWPVIGASLAIVWMVMLLALGRTGFWGGYGVFLLGMIGALFAKRAAGKRAA